MPGPSSGSPATSPTQSIGRPTKIKVHFVFNIAVAMLTMFEGALFILISTISKNSSLALILGLTIMIVGFLSLVVAYGLFKAAHWSWALVIWQGIAYVLLGLLFVLTIFGIVDLIFGIWSEYYINTREAKEYLGRKPKPA